MTLIAMEIKTDRGCWCYADVYADHQLSLLPRLEDENGKMVANVLEVIHWDGMVSVIAYSDHSPHDKAVPGWAALIHRITEKVYAGKYQGFRLRSFGGTIELSNIRQYY